MNKTVHNCPRCNNKTADKYYVNKRNNTISLKRYCEKCNSTFTIKEVDSKDSLIAKLEVAMLGNKSWIFY